MHRKGTINRQFVSRIPAAVRDRAVGLSLLVPIGAERVRCEIKKTTTTIRLSLRTADPGAVRQRQAQLAAFFEELWANLKAGEPIILTHHQCVALAREVFAAWSSTGTAKSELALQYEENKPGAASFWLHGPWAEWEGLAEKYAERASDRDALPVGELEKDFGRDADRLLAERGIPAIAAESRALLLWEILRAYRDAHTVQKRRSDGDFSPPPEANRFPEWVAPKPVAVVDPPKAAGKASGKVSLKGLVDSWWAEAKLAGRSQSTYESYRATINRFAAFVKHDDAQRVTNADVVRFKEHRIAAGASLKTVKDSDLVGLKALFNYALGNHLVAANPVDGVKVLRVKVAKTREQGFTAEEADAILAKAFSHMRAGKEKAQIAAAKRWVPWLCAYTGARVGEVVQLRKEDVKKVGDWWTITITPEAGTVKNKEVREVVLHAHLIEQGFPAFVAAAKAGHLFFVAKAGEETRGKWQATKNRLAEFAREVVPDKRVKPNHGWRHRFRTVGREVGIEDSVLDAIGGWAPGSVGQRYGDVSLAAKATAFAKFPRFKA